MSHDEQVSWEDISQHETTSKHRTQSCEWTLWTWSTDRSVATNMLLDLPGAQTRVWLSPTGCWIYLGHRHDCDCHQHALYLGGRHSAANAFKDPHCQEALIFCFSCHSNKAVLSHTGWKENVAWSGAPRLCTLAMNDMSMSGFRKQRCNICLTIERERSYQ